MRGIDVKFYRRMDLAFSNPGKNYRNAKMPSNITYENLFNFILLLTSLVKK